MTAFLPVLRPQTYKPHKLHDMARAWPETNCYVDVWIEVLASLGHEPCAAAGFTVEQDFEGDQFTFFKYPPEDLDLLFGISVQELAIYDKVEKHALEQIRRGRLPLVEVDSFYLPDTTGLSYRIEHTKTTIGINRIDIDGRRMEYFHGGGYFEAAAEDFDGLFRVGTHASQRDVLFPYVEFVKLNRGPEPARLVDLAVERLRHHVSRRPQSNPFVSFRDQLAGAVAQLINGADFHKYAFNTVRQFGANFDLLAAHLQWLADAGGPHAEVAIAKASRISEAAKTLQFQMARAVA